MNSKKYLALIVGCGIALLLAIGAAVLLVMSMSSHGKSEAELKTAMNRLEQLNRRSPFPAQENVAGVQSNLVLLKKTLAEVQLTVGQGQIEPDDIERAEFGPMLERTVKRLRSAAVANHVVLPEKFAFGFDRYSAGDLPQTSAVRRLVTQLKTISAVCDLIYAAKVTNLLSVTREEFETQTAGGAVSESAPVSLFGSRTTSPTATTTVNLKEMPPVVSNELFVAERIGIQFAGRENSIFEVLNAFTKGAPFIVVRDVTLESLTLSQKGGEAKQTPFGGQAISDAAGAGGSSTNLIVPRDDRIVAGREVVKATVVLDVFRFAKEQGEAK